jgi:predicted aldo/keto reductase-like oxidoreductase
MKHPIEVFKHKISKTPRMGVGGKTYVEKKFSVLKGSQRVTRAIELGYTHIEAVVYD